MNLINNDRRWINQLVYWRIKMFLEIHTFICFGFTPSTIWTGRYRIKPINGPWTNTAILTSNRRGKNLKPSPLTTFRARLKLLALSIQCDLLPGKSCLIDTTENIIEFLVSFCQLQIIFLVDRLIRSLNMLQHGWQNELYHNSSYDSPSMLTRNQS